MAEGIKAGAVFLCVFIAAIFLTLGIYTLVTYYRLKKGEDAVAKVTEHVREARHNNLLLKIRYAVNGVAYERTYGVVKTSEYMDAHPVGTEIKILVNSQRPQNFVLLDDVERLRKPGIFYVLVSAAALAGFIAMLPGIIN